jgi:hypothetical protein
MPIVPAGQPAWTRATTFDQVGGHENKQDFGGRKGLDALTDVNAEQFARLTADVPAMVRTAPFCILSFGCIDTPSGAPPVLGGYYDGAIVTSGGVHMMTGVRMTAYAGDEPPAGYPSAVRVSNGCIDITFAASYTDAFGVEGAFSITQVKPGCAVATAVQRVVATVTSSTTVRVSVFDAADAPVPNARVSAFRVY